jgi:hypothetical protein
LHEAIFEPLLNAGRVNIGEKYKVVPDETDFSTFWIFDAETMSRAKQTKSEAEDNNLWQKINNEIKTFRTKWAKKQPKISAV